MKLAAIDADWTHAPSSLGGDTRVGLRAGCKPARSISMLSPQLTPRADAHGVTVSGLVHRLDRRMSMASGCRLMGNVVVRQPVALTTVILWTTATELPTPTS